MVLFRYKYLSQFDPPNNLSRTEWQRNVKTARSWLNGIQSNSKVSIICQIEILSREYEDARLCMMEVYIFRASFKFIFFILGSDMNCG